MDTLSLEVSPRDIHRKKVDSLRKNGITPLHLYGKGITSVSLQADTLAVSSVVRKAGHNIPVSITTKGTKAETLVFVGEVQYNPMTNQLLHVDFFSIDINRPLKRDIPISLTGESPGVRVHRGVLVQGLHALAVESLPLNMPERIEVDISVLQEIDQGIRVADYTPSAGISVLSDPEDLIVRVSAPRVDRSARADFTDASDEMTDSQITVSAEGEEREDSQP